MEKIVRDLEKIRDDMDTIDRRIADLFEQRMKISAEMAYAKKGTREPVYDKNREDEKLADLTTAGGTRTLPSFGHALTKEDIIDLYRLAERKAVEE